MIGGRERGWLLLLCCHTSYCPLSLSQPFIFCIFSYHITLSLISQSLLSLFFVLSPLTPLSSHLLSLTLFFPFPILSVCHLLCSHDVFLTFPLYLSLPVSLPVFSWCPLTLLWVFTMSLSHSPFCVCIIAYFSSFLYSHDASVFSWQPLSLFFFIQCACLVKWHFNHTCDWFNEFTWLLPKDTALWRWSFVSREGVFSFSDIAHWLQYSCSSQGIMYTTFLLLIPVPTKYCWFHVSFMSI